MSVCCAMNAIRGSHASAPPRLVTDQLNYLIAVEMYNASKIVTKVSAAEATPRRMTVVWEACDPWGCYKRTLSLEGVRKRKRPKQRRKSYPT